MLPTEVIILKEENDSRREISLRPPIEEVPLFDRIRIPARFTKTSDVSDI
jgi:hypothetical protein